MFRASFDTSILVMIVMSIILIFTWPENYGDSNAAVWKSFYGAYECIRKSNFT